MIGVHDLSRVLVRPRGAEKGTAMQPRSTCVADIATSSALILLGAVVIVAAIEMGIGWGSDGPESGFFPFWLATILVLASAVNVVKAARQRSDQCFVRREQLACVLTVLVPAAAMVALTWFVGLYVAAALYMGFSMRWSGRNSWAFSIALPIAISTVVFLIFERWFLVPLPKGPFEAWLGY